MATALDQFERVVRSMRATPSGSSEPVKVDAASIHPFELHNIHPDFPKKVRKLFDDGHGAEATFHAFKFIEKVVQKHANSAGVGRRLMMTAFHRNNPQVPLNSLANTSEEDEQEGYSFIFAGAMMAIRNPGGHEIELSDDPDVCLDHLAFGTLLLRRLERSGFKTS